MKVALHFHHEKTLWTLDSEWEFVQGLAYASQTSQDAQCVQLIYTSRLRKYKYVTERPLTRQRLVEEYNLGDNPDVLFSFADALYFNFRWADCFTITSRYEFNRLVGLSNLTSLIETLVLFPSTTKPCLCILHACTIFLISILNFLFWHMRWSTGSRKILLVGMRLECGIWVAENGLKRDGILGKMYFSPEFCHILTACN